MVVGNAAGQRLHRSEEGPRNGNKDAKTVIMLSGLVRNGTFWNDWMPALALNHRVIRPDQWGVGRNPDPGPDYQFRLDGAVQDLIDLIEEVGAPVNQVGESAGGMISALAAASRPDLFESLTLISTPTILVNGGKGVKSPGAESPTEAMEKLGLKQWFMQSRALTKDVLGDERDERFAEEFALTPVHVAVSLYKAVHEPDVSLQPILSKITTPTLVMSPTISWTASAEDQQLLVDSIPNTTWKVYEGATHDMSFLRGAELAPDLVAFLDSLS